MKFRMREVVDAVQFIDSDHPLPAGVERGEEAKWGGSPGDQSFFNKKYGPIYNYHIETSVGKIPVRPGDWILTDSQGSKLTYPDDIFHKIFEPVYDERLTCGCGGIMMRYKRPNGTTGIQCELCAEGGRGKAIRP